ncbi:probable desumoylating isopeptidase 1 at N-terminal half [Coccomyxa sp. Obi]|nr:probable desumoylating isopeptidase 1 at N-terminal half [Coccomyxa sp. Obi]
MASEEGQKVLLYVYDLSQGFAAQVSQSLLGKHIAGIWHTAIVVGGYEYFYGGGVQKAMAGSTPYGHPVEIVDLGHTQIPEDILEDYINELRQVYTPEAYNLFTNNCNNFSNELATFLTGQPIPEHITNLPAEVLSTPMGQMLAPMLSGMESQLGSVQAGDAPLQLNSPVPNFMLPQLPQGTPAQMASTSAGSAQHQTPQVPQGTPAQTASPHATSAPSQTPQVASAPTGGRMEATVNKAAASAEASAGKVQEMAGPSQPTDTKADADTEQAKARAKMAFEAAVRSEFARIMSVGKNTANEAAALAVAAARQSLSRQM